MATSFPHTRRSDHVDVLHGHEVADPYRWLEDPDHPEVVDWVERQRAFAEAQLAELPERPWFRATMRAIVQRPRAGVPLHKGGWYVVTRNDGTQNQDVLCVAPTLDELATGGRVLLDPNTWSADGTTSLGAFTLSSDGRYLAYSVNEAGSDWQKIRVVDVATGASVPVVGDDHDSALVTKFAEPAWLPDNQSFLYHPVGDAERAEGTATEAVGALPLAMHHLGDEVADDTILAAFPEDDRIMTWGEPTADGRWLAIGIVVGTENRNRLWLSRTEVCDGRTHVAAPLKIVDEPVAEFALVRTAGDVAYLSTDLDAPLGRVVSVDLAAVERTGQPTFHDVVAEADATLTTVVAAGDTLAVASLMDAQPQIRRVTLAGDDLGLLDVPGGALVDMHGSPESTELLVGLSSLTSPTTSYQVDTVTGAVSELRLVAPGGYEPPQVHVERRRAPSKDGTLVPYFLVTRADLDFSSPRPTLLYGYGGFKIPVEADYRPGWSAWLEAGGVLVLANLRGGGEYGTAWYDAGRLANKQNVFDDFIGVAEHLQADGVTTPAQLALYGRSNGGLLVGAVMTQRPDLMACALPGVGVLDVLRFHRFTIGAAWTSDYGDPDVADDFAAAWAYSPVHQVREGTRYPATLITTGDHDDRVVPLHSHKFAATLQHAQAGDAPILTRIEVATGHGQGKPLAMVADEWADMLAFAAHFTGLEVPSRVTLGR